MSRSECLGEDEFLQISSGGMPGAVEAHLAQCVACREVAALLLSGTFGGGTPGQTDASAVPLAFDLLPGDFCDRFEIRSFLGQGGMGTVFRAHDPALKRDVALKITPFPEASLHHEARAMARVRDPRVVTVYEVVPRPYVRRRGDETLSLGTGYLVMEWVDGVSLRHHLIRAEEVVSILFDIARAIEAVHAVGIVHGDVKPDNVLIVREGAGVRAKLGDFGLAQVSDGGAASPVGGTRGYAAPEVLRGAPATVASDIFAFSKLATELLSATNQRPSPLLTAGTAEAPGDRPPSMAPFVAALRPRPRAIPGIVGVGIAAVALVLSLLFVVQRPATIAIHLRPMSQLPTVSPAGTHLVDMTIENHRDHPVSIAWVDFDGRRVPYQTIAARGVVHQETYSGHVWVVESAMGSEVLGFVAPESGQVVSVE